MFTGIVEAIARVRAIDRGAALARLQLEAPEICEGIAIGDSVAVNGVCLTVTSCDAGVLGFEAIPETLEKSALADLQPGATVNVERAMRAGDRLDGHIVQGHVDDTGRVGSLERAGDDVRLWIECTPAFAELLVDKGSVAIDGVSLTVVSAGESAFDVALIPHTCAVTTLGALEVGRRVNLEADVLGKYVKRYLERVLPARPGSARPGPA